MTKQRLYLAAIAGLLMLCFGLFAAEAQQPEATANADYAGKAVTVASSIRVLVVRQTPAQDAQAIEALVGGVTVTLSGASQLVDRITWWEIQTPSNQTGWIPETQDGKPTLLFNGNPLSNSTSSSTSTETSPLPIPNNSASSSSSKGRSIFVAVDILPVYVDADPSSAVVEAAVRDVALTVVAEPKVVGDVTWYQVQTPSGSTGWIPETLNSAKTFKSATAENGQLDIGSTAVVGGTG